MSELQDAAQIIRVTFEGTEILMKLGKYIVPLFDLFNSSPFFPI